MTRDRKEAQLHDRQDDLVRELEETNRELARTIELTRKALAIVEHAKDVLAQVLGEAKFNVLPRAAPSSPCPSCATLIDGGFGSAAVAEGHRRHAAVAPSPSAEQIENDHVERRGGR